MIDYFMTNDALLQYVDQQMRQMRINARLSQQQLAERAGVSRSTVTQVENGKGCIWCRYAAWRTMTITSLTHGRMSSCSV